LGGGPNRIGQGIEFDYCCCQASFALKEAGFETIMINCNPETVSTDYDTSDRLYFEPLIEEYVQNIILKEKSNGNLLGVIAQFGGQTPIKLAKFLYESSLPILGTQYSSIDLAEDRDRFRNLLIKLNLKQAESGIAYTYNQAIKISDKIGLPLVIRPSYVLGGRAMEIVHEKNQLKEFINEAFKASEENPILIDKFINNAMEVDVDAISDGKDVYVAGIMQHIEEAGIHSGDSACCLPPISIKDHLLRELKIQTRKLALALNVKGFLNIQFAIKKDEIFVIEVNPRASRTVPFVSKANGIPLAKIASRIMAGEKLAKYKLKYQTNKTFAVKEAVFPFNKFPDSDVLLGPEMKSTGEVMGFDDNFGMAYAKSQIAASNSLPTKGLAFLSVKDSHKDEVIDIAKKLIKLNFNLCGTEGTTNAIRKNSMKCKKINKVSSGTPHIVDVLNSKKISLVINTGGGKRKHRISDARALRRATLINKVPYCTNMSTAYACLEGIRALKTRKLKVKSLQEV
ncbi:carbamoyl-phosphate synthase large subunit, partial [Candidatus Pelagibacter sp.]|nr:carbamoyl-phosphate synthase large subunit [Candidatus Pelagibacter sp.]